ncbi:MAG: radical SAM family heme chaperone HemW, partial [Proteobacteria bacterium]|nr:radical SAM family heme chaperone HemW [Pseudomonadota bacterium]
WCVKKCPYCDFNSHEFRDTEFQEQQYIDALIHDLELELPRIWGRRIISIFIGGGTPSLFSVAAINRLLSELRARLTFYPEIEITLEANPGTAEAEKFQGYRAIGINRLSIGVQSFNDKYLKSLGRIHNAKEALTAIELCHQAGFEDFNIDLMFGLPEQTINSALDDLHTAIENKPRHISWYQLTIEPNTIFAARPPVLPEDDAIWQIQSEGQSLLQESGFKHYEISAYALDGYQCVHNLNYWEFGDYLGLGAGAHGKITNVPEIQVQRFKRHSIPARYIELAGTQEVITEQKTLTRNDLSLEFMMNAMRLNNGTTPSLFFERTGQPITQIKDKLTIAEESELLDWRPDRLKATSKGLRYLNELLEIFVD